MLRGDIIAKQLPGDIIAELTHGGQQRLTPRLRLLYGFSAEELSQRREDEE